MIVGTKTKKQKSEYQESKDTMLLNFLCINDAGWSIVQCRDSELEFKGHDGDLKVIATGYENLQQLRGNNITVLSVSTLPPEVEAADNELHRDHYKVGYWVPIQGTQDWIAKVFRAWKGRPSTQYALVTVGKPGIKLLRAAKEL